MEDDLVAAYSGLGTADGNQYYRGEECIGCVKDLIRSLRDDDPQRCPVRRRLGQAKILQNDLLPLLTKFSDDEILKNDIIRLLVNLTQPAYLCFGNEYPSLVGRHKDPELMKSFIEVNNCLKFYKEAFANQKVMHVLGSTLADHCQKDWECRDEDDMIIIERILLLIRNILHIPTEASEEQELHANGIDELLVFLGSNPEEKQWCMHVMEILYLMLREQSAKPLATAGRGRSATEKEKDLRALNDLLLEENAQRMKSRSKLSTRHSRFGGTFMLMNKKGIADNPMIYHRPLPGINSYSHDVEKVRRRRPCNMQPVRNPPIERMSTLSIRLSLQQMCVQFLQCCYNPVMKLTKDNLMRERAMEHDDTYYLWVMRFFMEFSRHYQFRVDIIGETLTLSTLHYVLSLMSRHYENMKMQKRELTAKHSSQRLHYAIQAYKELLEYVQYMGESQDDALRSNATIMKNNILYRPEYRDIFVTVIRNYNEVVSSRALLRDLVETVHIYLRLVEQLCKKKGRVLVQGKRKKRGAGSRKKSRKETENDPVVLSSNQLQEMWDHMRGDVERAIDAELASCDPMPFDAASDMPIEEQKFSAIAKLRELLRDGKYPESIALVRAAREVWPDDVFGAQDMDTNEQRDVIKKIFLDPVSELMSAGIADASVEDGYDEEDEEQEIPDEVPEETFESEFNLKSYLLKFATSQVVKTYCYLLKEYRSNSDTINHCVVKMLHRIAFQLKMCPLLYQLQVFKIFQSIMNEPATSRMKEMQIFAKHIVRGFFEAANNNPIMFVEVLFWKSTADCYEITEGYGSLARERDAKVRASMWTREQEEELAELYQQYQEEDDIVGCIIAALPGNPPRSRQKVAAQLVRQGCVSSTRELKKKKASKGTHWSTEDDERLQEYMGSHHPNTPVALSDVDMNALIELFPGKTPAIIERHLRRQGFTYRPRKKQRRKKSSDDYGEDSRMEDEEDVCSDDSQGQVIAPPQPKKRRKMSKQTEPARKRVKPPSGNVIQLIKQLIDQGYSEQLTWLRQYLSDETSDRRADDEWEEICIVPVDEEVAVAIECADYQSLLISLGMQPPSDMEQYWRIPADMTPAQLDEATQALQLDGNHDNSTLDQSEDGCEPTRGDVREEEEEENALCTVPEELAVKDGTPPDQDIIANNDDDGTQSDSSEHSGLCIDYHSDTATEETDRATVLATLVAKRKHQQATVIGTEDNGVDSSPSVTEKSYDKSSMDAQQDGGSLSPSCATVAAEDARYASTRKRRLLLMDDDDNDNEEDNVDS